MYKLQKKLEKVFIITIISIAILSITFGILLVLAIKEASADPFPADAVQCERYYREPVLAPGYYNHSRCYYKLPEEQKPEYKTYYLRPNHIPFVEVNEETGKWWFSEEVIEKLKEQLVTEYEFRTDTFRIKDE